MQYEKIAPTLLAAFEDYQEQGRDGLLHHMEALTLVAPENTPKPPRTVVFIFCNEDAELSYLVQQSIYVNQSEGRVRTAFLPLDSLDALSEDAAIERIIPSQYLQPLMDVAASKINLPIFKNNTGLVGKGVIVGVIDTGIDPNHPAFAGRILRIWDQTQAGGPGVLEGGYGLEVTGLQLTASRDTNGHGTHVAGIATGDDPVFGGVAPEADLVIVKTDFSNGHIADAVRYVFRVAGDLGRPAVVNLSLGGHTDPHDGTDPLSIIIDEQSGPGRIVCCAAGNEGNDNIHAQAIVQQGTDHTLRFQVPNPGGTEKIMLAILNGWYSGNDSIEVSVQSPSGFQTPFQAIIPIGNPGQAYNLPEGRVRIFTPGPDLENGDHNFFILIDRPATLGATSPVTSGIWRLFLRGTAINQGIVNIWTVDDNRTLTVTFLDDVQDGLKIGSPGSAASAVTVAAYTTKLDWIDIDGNQQQINWLLDDITDFSSEGPLRNGDLKPDVAAPGAWIGSALSADALFPRRLMLDAQHLIIPGTSMATPIIAGIAALLLEHDSTLDPDQIKDILRANSSIPNQPAGTFDPKWGHGLIDTFGL